MIALNNREDIGFDFERAKKCVDHYSHSTGIKSFIINAQGETLYRSGNRADCSFCCNIQGSSSTGRNCQKVHLYGSYQAERFGGKYIFFCPVGMTHWASPITIDGSIQGAILGGPVMMMDPEEFLLDDFIKSNSTEYIQIEKIKKHLEEIPIIQPDVVSSLSEMLFITAAHLSDIQPAKYYEERENQQLQADISQVVHHIKAMGGDGQEISVYPLDKEKELLSRIALADKPGSQKVLNEILGYIFFSAGGNFDVIKSRILELMVLLSRAALEGGADIEQIFGLNYGYLTEINQFKTVDELASWLSKIMIRFTDCVFNFANIKHVDIIYKSIDFVKRNYMRKISLEDVAAHVFLSNSYFSKIFKEETQCSFNTYLNQVRIEMSKNLLKDESISLIDVSSLVGFEDQSYFSKVFKKMTGMSPRKYRESRGQIRN